MERDGVSPDEVRLRIKRQMSEEERKKRADYMINNDEKEMLLPQLIELHEGILRKVN